MMLTFFSLDSFSLWNVNMSLRTHRTSGKTRKEYDGAYLCLECMGAELRNQFPKVNDWESQKLSEEDLWGKY
jgi:hypothetical protein